MANAYTDASTNKPSAWSMVDIGFPLIAFAAVVWLVYAAFRMAPFVEQRWKAWGEVVAFLIFLVGMILIEVVFSRA